MKFKFTKETAKRMLKTFVQTAAGYIIVNIKPYEQIVLDGMGNEFKSALFEAVRIAISA